MKCLTTFRKEVLLFGGSNPTNAPCFGMGEGGGISCSSLAIFCLFVFNDFIHSKKGKAIGLVILFGDIMTIKPGERIAWIVSVCSLFFSLYFWPLDVVSSHSFCSPGSGELLPLSTFSGSTSNFTCSSLCRSFEGLTKVLEKNFDKSAYVVFSNAPETFHTSEC